MIFRQFSSTTPASISLYNVARGHSLASHPCHAAMFLYIQRNRWHIHGKDGQKSLLYAYSNTCKGVPESLLSLILHYSYPITGFSELHSVLSVGVFPSMRRSYPRPRSLMELKYSNLLLARIESWASLHFDPTKHSGMRIIKPGLGILLLRCNLHEFEFSVVKGVLKTQVAQIHAFTRV